jgi:hypothetical protein
MMSCHSWLVRIYLWQGLYRPRLHTLSLVDRLTLWLIPASLLMMAGGHASRISLLDSIYIYGFELLMGLGVVFWLTSWIREKRLFPYKQVWLVHLFMLCVWMVGLWLNVGFLGDTVWKASLYWWRYCLYAVWGYSLFTLTSSGMWRFSWRRMLLYFAFMMALLGWFQYLFIPDMRWLYALGFDDHLNRMVGSLFDPTFLGLLLLLGLIAGYSLPVGKNPLLLGMFSMGILLTYARSIYFLLIITIVVFGIWKGKYAR